MIKTFPADDDVLPTPDPQAQAQSRALLERLLDLIEGSGGFLDFERFMHEALYAPGLGYYSAGATKLGRAGDFVTAPEISPLFAGALNRQIQQITSQSGNCILELGAGSGRLAFDILKGWRDLGLALPSYRILEVSADLRARQQALFASEPALLACIQWLDAWPDQIEGAVLANEVLDAVPCRVAEIDQGLWFEIGVSVDGNGALVEARRAAPPDLTAKLAPLMPRFEGFAGRYRLELNVQAAALSASVAERIAHGAALFIDYGFPEHEFYHPQRHMGTLMAHYRHYAHGDLLRWPGLQDLTSHIDFTAMAHAADDAGATLYGFTSQARFLLNCGIADLMEQHRLDQRAALIAASGLKRLTSEVELGELFKVLAFGRGLTEALIGFAEGDRLNRL